MRTHNVKRRQSTEKHALPGLILPGQWEVHESMRACVEVHSKRLYVPYGNGIVLEQLRAHEYGHVKWSPEKPPSKGHPDYIEAIKAVEDVRIDTLLKRSGVSTYDIPGSRRGIKELMGIDVPTPDTLYGQVLAYVCSKYRKDREEVNKELTLVTPDIRHFIDRLFYLADHKIFRFRSYTPPIAKTLFAAFHPEDKKKDDKKAKTGEGGTKGSVGGSSGTMSIHNCVDMRARSRLRARCTDTGMSFRSPERILTDGRAFREVRREKHSPVSVLLDCSGSMFLDMGEVRKLVDMAHGGTVAGYSGNFDKGVLEILSDKGKMCSELPAFHSGNIIDFPALKWLSRQPSPTKLWVSDGKVTGIGDCVYTDVTVSCLREATLNGIKRVDNIQGALSLMK